MKPAGCVLGAVAFAAAVCAAHASTLPRAKPQAQGDDQFDRKEIRCLATAVYFEARGESLAGQFAVADVILNRVESKLYPDTVCSVVHQNADRRDACQFSFACDGKAEDIAEPEAFALAERVASASAECNSACRDSLGGTARSTHYHSQAVSPGWAGKLARLGRIGNHIFYRSSRI